MLHAALAAWGFGQANGRRGTDSRAAAGAAVRGAAVVDALLRRVLQHALHDAIGLLPGESAGALGDRAVAQDGFQCRK